jgi:hypothetical protein
MKSFLFLAITLMFSSCGIYSSRFDCPPGKGIGCAPVNEVLDLIVEKKTGEDVFVNNKGTALLLKQQEEQKLIQTATPARKKYHLIQDETGNWKLVKLPKEVS